VADQGWFLLEEVAIPLLAAGLFVLGRKSLPRTILVLSAGALLVAGIKWMFFAVEYGRGAFMADGWLHYPLEPSLLVLDYVRAVMLTFALFMGIAAWILALYDCVSQRRWGWFSGIIAVTVLSYVAGGIDNSPQFMRQNSAYDQLMRGHFLAVFILLGTLEHLSALITLVYALVMQATARRPLVAD
jgi:hypothetical protein